MKDDISRIEWPDYIKAKPYMCYESIAHLYGDATTDSSDTRMSFAVSSTDYECKQSDIRGCIHKLDIIESKLKVTHEVLPKQGACSQIIPVNEKLRVACFDEGSILPISNFGPKKTFHCDVRGRLQHHSTPVNCIATNTKGTHLASGSIGGQIALYDVSNESINYLSRVDVSSAAVTGLVYLQPHEDICLEPCLGNIFDGENILVYSTQDGHIGLLDSRCELGHQIDFAKFMTTEPRLNLTTLCYVDSLPGQIIFAGTSLGRLIAIDLRSTKGYLINRKLPEDVCMRRMKKVTILSQEENKSKDFLAYTNETNSIKIIEPTSLEMDEHWECERISTGIVKDFCQVGKKIITCGSESSIGLWNWKE